VDSAANQEAFAGEREKVSSFVTTHRDLLDAPA